MEFVGPGVANLSADFRIGIDVMTTETTCLSSIWQTDDQIREFYEIHGREAEYKELAPGQTAYYDGLIEVDLSFRLIVMLWRFCKTFPKRSESVFAVSETT